MNIQARNWKGSTLQLNCKFQTDPIKTRELVAKWLRGMEHVDDLTPNEIELRDELRTWLNAQYGF